MSYDKDKQFTFKESKDNKGVIKSLRDLAKKGGRRFNDYLNIILSKHVQDHHEDEE